MKGGALPCDEMHDSLIYCTSGRKVVLTFYYGATRLMCDGHEIVISIRSSGDISDSIALIGVSQPIWRSVFAFKKMT